MIKNITMEDQFRDSVDIIRLSFETVAVELNLTRNNCPTHPSFITHDDLLALKRKGLNLFGLFVENYQIAFVAVEKANDDLFYIEKLAVLPQHRHQGFGKQLMLCAIEYIKKSMGKKISIGIINEHSLLKNWYKNIGFREVATKNFVHLPFTVCFLEMNL
jgi:ribosomal protein S18 acetylase RimI-like enzyme